MNNIPSEPTRRIAEGTPYAATLTANRVSIEGGVLWRGMISFDQMDYNLMYSVENGEDAPLLGWRMMDYQPDEAGAFIALAELHVKLADFIGKYPNLFTREAHSGN